MSETAPHPPPVAPETPLSVEQARLLPFYHDLRNEIVEPDRVVVSSQYFWTRWAPRLGPTLAVLIVCLRRHCYYNKLTQERRDWCFPEQATLAREIGVESTKTIRAAFQHPLAAYFVRREARYVYDPNRGKKIRTSDMYYVAMDDPLLPEDEALLVARAAERLLHEGREREMLHENPPPALPNGEKRRQVARGPTGQKRHQAPIGRLDLQDSTVISTPEDVHETCTLRGIYSMVQSPMKAERAEAKPQGTNSTNPPPPEEPRASGGALELVPGLEVQSGPLWRAVRDEAARGVKVPTDRILLAQCELLGRQGEVLIVGLPGRSATERAALRLRHPLATAVRIVLGRAVELDFINAADWPAPAHR